MADEKPIIIIKKKKGGESHGHHGGAWKVAYADFVTAMMAFFLVMWLMAADEETKASISNYFNNPTGDQNGASHSKDVLGRNPGGTFQSPQEVKARNDLTNPNRPEAPTPVHLEEHKILQEMAEIAFEGSAFSVDTDEERVKLSVPGSVIFEPGGTVISAKGIKYLAKVSSIIKEYTGSVSIIGHADKAEYEGLGLDTNKVWQLSFDRALAIRNHLVNIERVKPFMLVPTAKGDTDLVIKDDRAPASKRDKNRRVEFVFRHKRDY